MSDYQPTALQQTSMSFIYMVGNGSDIFAGALMSRGINFRDSSIEKSCTETAKFLHQLADQISPKEKATKKKKREVKSK